MSYNLLPHILYFSLKFIFDYYLWSLSCILLYSVWVLFFLILKPYVAFFNLITMRIFPSAEIINNNYGINHLSAFGSGFIQTDAYSIGDGGGRYNRALIQYWSNK